MQVYVRECLAKSFSFAYLKAMRNFAHLPGLRLSAPLMLMALFLVGCQTMNPKTQAASDQWRVMSLEESFLEFNEAQQAQVNSSKQTEIVLKERMMALEEQVAALRNALADKAMKSAVVPSKPSVVAQSSEDKPWVKVPKPEPAPKPKPKPKSASSGEKSLYEKGYNLAVADKSPQARDALDSFMSKYPKSKLMPNALYWKGETYYAEKNYPQAILTFKDVTQRYPRHAKAQAALLKIGMSYRGVGDADNAIFYLRTLVDEHPNSSPAKIAKNILKDIPE